MLEISLAVKSEYCEIRTFYHTLIDKMDAMEYKSGWIKEVYPTNLYLQESIEKQELYLGRCMGEIAAAMIFNHGSNEGYQQAEWLVSAESSETMVIHALGVMPEYSGKGCGKEMVQKALEIAKERKMKSVRLDVLGGNLRAQKLYEGLGFHYVKTVKMYYEDTGLTDFLLYEYPL